MKKKKIKPQGRDFNILNSFNRIGQKLIQKVLLNKKKSKKVKHRYEMFDD